MTAGRTKTTRRKHRRPLGETVLTALHEAAHAVVSTVLHAAPVETVSIRPATTHDGATTFRGNLSISARRQRVESEIAVYLAGPLAEEIATERRPFDGGEDVDEALFWLHVIDGPPVRFGELWERTRRIVRSCWRAILAVAGALVDVGKLTGSEVRQIVADAGLRPRGRRPRRQFLGRRR